MFIRTLELPTRLVGRLRAFYGGTLGLNTIELPDGSLEVQVGTSNLRFVPDTSADARPQHFAFNVPEALFAAAAAWLDARAPLLQCDASGRLHVYSEEWDAHSAYAFDPAGNIIEVIARHALPDPATGPFGPSHLRCISEFGLACDDVLTEESRLGAAIGAPVYRGPGSDTFTAIGDEHGLLILVKRARIWFPHTGVPAGSCNGHVVIADAAGRIARINANDLSLTAGAG